MKIIQLELVLYMGLAWIFWFWAKALVDKGVQALNFQSLPLIFSNLF